MYEPIWGIHRIDVPRGITAHAVENPLRYVRYLENPSTRQDRPIAYSIGQVD